MRRRYEWRNSRFAQQVSFSLNTLVDRNGSKVLLIRTLLEDTAANVWLNEFGISKVVRAAGNTTLDNPFIEIEDQRDRDIVMVAVLNVLSERFSDAFIAQALGLPTSTDAFLYGLTWERYGEMKTQKLRVMIVKRSDLETTFTDGDSLGQIGVLEDSHRPRVKTLSRMADIWMSNDKSGQGMIREVELGVVRPEQTS